jgi:hypothetical protein
MDRDDFADGLPVEEDDAAFVNGIERMLERFLVETLPRAVG